MGILERRMRKLREGSWGLWVVQVAEISRWIGYCQRTRFDVSKCQLRSLAPDELSLIRADI